MTSTALSQEWIESANADDSVMGNVVESYRQAGFEAGYKRAANDLLADFILLATRLRSGGTGLPPDRLADLRDFEQQLERTAEGSTALNSHVYVDGGLGI